MGVGNKRKSFIEKRQMRDIRERYDCHGSFVFLRWNIVSFSFLDIFYGLLD